MERLELKTRLSSVSEFPYILLLKLLTEIYYHLRRTLFAVVRRGGGLEETMVY